MSIFSTRLSCAAVAAAAALSLAGSARAQSIDGTLTAGDGYTLTSTQINATTSPTDGGGPGGPSNEVTASSTGTFTQLSNVYSVINPTTNTLNLFIGGSINQGDQGVSHYIIALQTNANGVSSLANVPKINGSVYNVNNPNATDNGGAGNDGLLRVGFDTGFKPNALFIVQPDTSTGTTTGTAAYTGFTDLSGGGATESFTTAYNGSLANTPIGTGATGDPGFAGASTGLELSIPLTPLGYTPGTSIEGLAFTTNGGADGRTNNQILSPFAYGSAPSDYDYTYIDANRQFDNDADYPGNQYFTIGAPEPTSLSFMALGSMTMLRRRVRRS